MKVRKVVVSTLSIIALFANSLAHANFSKALDAYIARDGGAMLEAVQHAVETSNNDGLMLFLLATTMDEVNSDYDGKTNQYTSMLRSMLSRVEWSRLSGLRLKATNNSSLDAQYYLQILSQFKKPYKERIKLKKYYISQNSQLALRQSNSLIDRAKAGDPKSQLELALNYLNNEKQQRCTKNLEQSKCLSENREKGKFWLRNAVQSFDKDGSVDPDILAGKVCDLLLLSANGNVSNLKEAYLWAHLGMQERSQPSESRLCLRDLQWSGGLELVASKLDDAWVKKTKKSDNNFNDIVYKTKLKVMPKMLAEARSNLTEIKLPIFSYYFSEDHFELQLFKGGELFINREIKQVKHKEFLKKLTLDEVNKFFNDLEDTGFYDWTMEDTEMLICDNCKFSKMKVVSRRSGHTYQTCIERDNFWLTKRLK